VQHGLPVLAGDDLVAGDGNDGGGRGGDAVDVGGHLRRVPHDGLRDGEAVPR
jgi:hypothetical protein